MGYTLTIPSIGSGSPTDLTSLEVELAWSLSYPSSYKEITRSLGFISLIETWDTVAKVTPMFTKAFTYDGSNRLSQVTITNLLNGAVLVKDFTYDVDSLLTTITRTYTP